MMKSILSCDRDLKEQAVIEKRRCAEILRKQRFFDEKHRVLGVDCNALDKQLMEKEQIKAAEREQERLEAEEMRKNLEIAEQRERDMFEQKRQAEIELNEFRRTCQQPDNTSDFDLIDPNGNKKSLPARLDDEDPRLSISGGQLFIGEDLMSQIRVREQKMLQKQWLDQQIAERKKFDKDKQQADKQMSVAMCKHDDQAVFLGNRLNDDKRDLQRQIREYNQSLAQQKRENDKKRKEMEQKDNLAEIYNFLSSDLLKENQPKGSNFGPNRCITYAYKGMI
jgi:predicted nucleotidyltransferase component of viral defense system